MSVEKPVLFVKPNKPVNFQDEVISREEYNQIIRSILTSKQMTEYMHMMANSAIVAENNNIKGMKLFTIARSRILYDIHEQNGMGCNS